MPGEAIAQAFPVRVLAMPASSGGVTLELVPQWLALDTIRQSRRMALSPIEREAVDAAAERIHAARMLPPPACGDCWDRAYVDFTLRSRTQATREG